MGKKLIGISLGKTMGEILLGNVAEEDIEKIYAGTSITEEKIPELIEAYKNKWIMVAGELAGKEVLKKYGLKKRRDIDTIEDEEKRIKVQDEYYVARIIGKEELKLVIEKAEALLHRLWNDNKINQTRYKVPKGQTVMVKDINVLDEQQGWSFTGDGRTEVALINGEYYRYVGPITSMTHDVIGFYDSELALIADHLSYIVTADSHFKKGRFNYLKKMFPQYEAVLDRLSDKLRIYAHLQEEELMEMLFLDKDKILAMLQEALTQEHTAEKIGNDLSQVPDVNEMSKEAFTAVTKSPAKEPTGPNDH